MSSTEWAPLQNNREHSWVNLAWISGISSESARFVNFSAFLFKDTQPF